jgi:twinkle protein
MNANLRSDKGREQIESAIANFPNFVPESIDLSDFMEDETVHRVKPASAYKEKLLELIRGGGELGVQTPWEFLKGKFEFRPSELTVWSGYKGHGKSLVISQALEQFISNGQKVFIISPEFPPHRVLHRMLIQSFGVANGTVEMAVRWLEAVENSLWIYDQQSSLKPLEIPAICRYAVDRLKVDHILIDSLMKCGMGTDDYSAQKRFVDSIQQVAHRTTVHVHLVAHQRKGSSDEKIGGNHDVKGASEIIDLAENHIIIWRNKVKETGGGKQEDPDCILKVDAQRNADGWIGMLPLYFRKASFTFHQGA